MDQRHAAYGVGNGDAGGGVWVVRFAGLDYESDVYGRQHGRRAGSEKISYRH